jgi:[protein-PII] uridylyltransferase
MFHVKERLKGLHQTIAKDLAAGATGRQLVATMTAGVDALIVDVWQQQAPHAAAIADLIAVGGYGRGDLAPRSDWDLCILLPRGNHEALEEEIAAFLRTLWDAGAKVGASTRTVKQTLEAMQEDVNTATAALEHRLLAGSGTVYKTYCSKVRGYFRRRRKNFVESKLEEMQFRHQRNGNTAFLMEPDIKENRGGLRDIHSVFWMAQAWYGETEVAALQKRGAMSARECEHLLSAQEFLWQCRCFMHLQSRRGSDRLSFELQAMLAEHLGYVETADRPAVEVFMKDFFRHSGRVARVSGLLTMHFQEQLQPNVFSITWPLDKVFSLQAQRVSIQRATVFQEKPLRLLEIFHIAQDDRRHLSSTALRQVRADVMLIDDDFRNSEEAKAMFLAILRHPRNVATALREMNDTGVLGRFIPDFRHTVGLGQFNRYHAYTVDEHTLQAVAEARNFFHCEHVIKLPEAHDVALQLRRPELLFLALLFHDIAKGKPGDHSQLGQVLAYDYCITLGLDEEQAELVAWLVEMHLIMALTSQRFDLSDPDVIREFAEKVSDKERLNYLFLLTIADIVAVGPTVWNDWKGGLLRTLYDETAEYLLRGNHVAYGIGERAGKRITQLLQAAPEDEREHLQASLAHLPNRALMYYSMDELLLIARTIEHAGEGQHVHVSFDDHVAMFAVVALERKGLFAYLASALSSGSLDVLRAQALMLGKRQVLDVFYIRGDHGVTLTAHDIERLRLRIISMLEEPYFSGTLTPRRYKESLLMQRVLAQVRLLPQASSQQTVFEVTAADRPGLLAQLAGKLTDCGVEIHGASVSTFGEKAVDVFFVADEQGERLDYHQQQHVRQALLDVATMD